MRNNISTAVLGSTGYVGLELINLLNKHPKVIIKSLGSENHSGKDISKFDKRIKNPLPKLQTLKNIDLSDLDVVFLALPHSISHKFVKKNINKTKIIDLSADFRINSKYEYEKIYKNKHSCPELLNQFIYGLSEINYKLIKKSNNIAVPGCYPTSILIPLTPLIKNKLIKTNNIIIDSKSGYSGAGKKFDKDNIKKKQELNFYNYNTNEHRHINEIQQELVKFSKKQINFSFNPHIMPIFRGMMTTIYCDIEKNIKLNDLKNFIKKYYKNSYFIKILEDKDRADFFKVQYSNNCYIKFFKHYNSNKIIIVSLIDNLLKGASGQAVQCMNIMFNFDEKLGLDKLKSD